MKLVTFFDGNENLGVYREEVIYRVRDFGPSFPQTMIEYLEGGEKSYRQLLEFYSSERLKESEGLNPDKVKIMAPLPKPKSCRDGYAFRQHVETARRNRGVPMIPEFDQYPVFYFTNHQAIDGPGEIFCMPDHFRQLDFELEVAIIIGKKGRNIPASEADGYIAGYTIMNDLSARQLQMEEMLLNLGPAKGKDFSTVLGPWLVTPEELEQFRTETKEGHTGKQYNMEMSCHVNGIRVSAGNMNMMDWTFAELIERASYGADLYPGDVIGSGTVGTGCFLELNGTGKLNDPAYIPQWLKEGDTISLGVEGIGILTNVIRKEKSEWSILEQKKSKSPK
ncbi:MAG: fumarylacetoacetate hydrolase family protein [Cyclobacteriaceae bacterium]